jgi:hypothetical protein
MIIRLNVGVVNWIEPSKSFSVKIRDALLRSTLDRSVFVDTSSKQYSLSAVAFSNIARLIKPTDG